MRPHLNATKKADAECRSHFRMLLMCFVLLLLAVARSPVCAECNSCSAFNNLACVSQTQFQVCVNNYPSGSINSCPTGYVCSTSNATICQPNVANVLGDCTDCNKCDPTNTFACTGIRTFALCLGTGVMTDLTGSCAPYHVCSIDYSYICSNATLGIPPTCPSTGGTITSPTQAPSVTNPIVYCQTVQQNGRFPVGTNAYTTCKQYIYCFLNNNVWSGALYNCPGSTYFNSTSRYCTATLPANCGGTVQGLSLKSSQLLFDANP